MEAVLCLHAFQVQHEKIQPRRHVHIQNISTDATVSTQNHKALQPELDRDISCGPYVRKSEPSVRILAVLCPSQAVEAFLSDKSSSYPHSVPTVDQDPDKNAVLLCPMVCHGIVTYNNRPLKHVFPLTFPHSSNNHNDPLFKNRSFNTKVVINSPMIIAQALKSPISFFKVTLSLEEFLSFFFFSLSPISSALHKCFLPASVRSRYSRLNQAAHSGLPL